MHGLSILSFLCAVLGHVNAQDEMGFGNGTIQAQTKNWDIVFVKASGTLASLKPKGSDFDFLPYDLMQQRRRLQNGCHHWGDINIRYRESLDSPWTDASSAEKRAPVDSLQTNCSLLSSDLSPTMSTGPLRITRHWIEVSGDLALQFRISNHGDSEVEIGSLGFPAAVNNIFTTRNASGINEKCSFMDPYIGMDAGHLRIMPLSGTGPALVVTPLKSTPLEAYRYLEEEYRGDTRYGSNSFEGYFEWQVHTKAWAANEWEGVEPWNLPSSIILQPGESRKYGIRFTAVNGGIRDIDAAIQETETPTAAGIPGYIIPRDTSSKLFLQSSSDVASISAQPDSSLNIQDQGNKTFTVTPSESAWGRVRLTIVYEDDKQQTVHYFVTKSASETVGDLGRFLTTEQWFDDESDPFGRSPSIMGYDMETRSIVDQDPRVQVAGLSDEGGAGSYVAAAIKQVFQPNAEEISKLETFVEKVLYKTVQNEDFEVKRGIFYYEPDAVPGYEYSSDIDWSRADDKDYADEIDRAYNYVWPAATYWSLYRVGRAYPDLLKVQDWEWYLHQAFDTVMRCMQPDIGFNDQGLMGETVFGGILQELSREGKTKEANALRSAMRSRVDTWLTRDYPFGSEQSWDSTGQEGVYYWAKHFNETEMALKARNSVLGYVPTVPHWGYNGNARRYWDFVVAGKLRLHERQIHHYGSGLNALVLLSAFRDDPSDIHLLRAGYAGTSGPLSNINEEGFASCAMHSWPQHLFWDGFSGDYGPNFVGLALGSGTYLADDPESGLVVYGGNLDVKGSLATVQVRDPVRQKIFIGPRRTEIAIDAGIIEEFTYDLRTGRLTLTLGRLDDAPRLEFVTIWVSRTSTDPEPDIMTTNGGQLETVRGGTRISFKEQRLKVEIE